MKEILCVQFLSLDWIRNWILVLLNQDGRVNRLVLFVSKQIRDICMHIKLCKNYCQLVIPKLLYIFDAIKHLYIYREVDPGESVSHQIVC